MQLSDRCEMEHIAGCIQDNLSSRAPGPLGREHVHTQAKIYCLQTSLDALTSDGCIPKCVYI